MTSPGARFDSIAASYDAWYDTEHGAAVLAAELACLRALLEDALPVDGGLEVGTGTGRFAAALGLSDGLDPAREMLRLAAGRSVRVTQGIAEALPYRSGTFDAVVFVTALEFVDDVEPALAEARRVLRPAGRCFLGIIPRASVWGTFYRQRADEGDAVFSGATFFEPDAVVSLAARNGLARRDARTTLFEAPGERARPEVRDGIDPAGSFVALRFARAEAV